MGKPPNTRPVLRLILAGIFGVSSSALFAQSGATPLFPVFDTARDADFGNAKLPLQTYLNGLGASARSKNHFCVVGYRIEGGTRQAWVHWQEGGRLILWDAMRDPEGRRDALRLSRRDLDLDKDVVADETAAAGSTFLVTRKWVSQVLMDCVRFGRRYKVKASTKGT